mgnify:CR=1 FL=1
MLTYILSIYSRIRTVGNAIRGAIHRHASPLHDRGYDRTTYILSEGDRAQTVNAILGAIHLR